MATETDVLYYTDLLRLGINVKAESMNKINSGQSSKA